MFDYLTRSLLLRAGMAMGLVTALAVAGMASAVYVARSTYGEAAAVNLAGSLRMQSYNIAAALEAERWDASGSLGDIGSLVSGFEQRLSSPRLTDVVRETNRNSIQDAYHLVEKQWRENVIPLLADHLEATRQPVAEATRERIRLAYRETVGGFVADIDNLVRLLEEDAESRIHMLGLFQGISLFLTVAVAIATLYLLQIDVLGPLHDLLNAAERAGKGDFEARVSHTGSDELGRLGRAFNTMAADLSKMYLELEKRVMEKTRELTQRNRSLELLYTASQYLTEAPVAEPNYQKLVDNIKQVVEVEGVTLCRSDEGCGRAYRIARDGAIPQMCYTESCDVCLGDGRTRVIGKAEHGGPLDVLSVPVGNRESTNGVLLLEQRDGSVIEPWQVQLLETLGKHIGLSLEVSRRVAQGRRIALLEERSVMARELHDSLAQSLTYLKIQVTRLSMILRSGSEHSSVEDALSELKGGLEAAYRQLRELLTTFRLQMDGQGLGPALEKTVEEYESRCDVDISLENRLDGSPFSVNEEIHVLQIVREALSNVVHHSRATQARVRLEYKESEGVLVSIKDNGIGIPQDSERTHHYGLAIMRERANSLHGELTIEAQETGGTQVRLCLKPTGLQQETVKS